MFTKLEKNNRILAENYPKNFVHSPLSEAENFLGKGYYLTRISVGRYDEKQNWVHLSWEFAWVSDKAEGCWLKATFNAPKKPVTYKTAKHHLGACYLEKKGSEAWWVSKGDKELRVKAKINFTQDKPLIYSKACNLLGPDIVREYVTRKDEDGNPYTSAVWTVSGVEVPAWEPQFGRCYPDA